jgi:hypothetical protein
VSYAFSSREVGAEGQDRLDACHESTSPLFGQLGQMASYCYPSNIHQLYAGVFTERTWLGLPYSVSLTHQLSRVH